MALVAVRKLAAGLLSILMLAFGPTLADAAEEGRFVVAGGPVGGAYYRLAGEVCEAFTSNPGAGAEQCLVLPTAGSGENLERLGDGSVDFAILQSDWLFRAQSQSQGELRAVIALQGRFITVVAGPTSGIVDVESLKGRRVSFGPGGSPLSFGGETLLAAQGWEPEDLAEIVPLDLVALPQSLCDGRIDAFVLPLVHPDSIVAQSLSLCDARLVEVGGGEVGEALKAWPFLSALTLEPGLYPGQDGAVEGFGLRATLATTEQADGELVANLVEAVLNRRRDARDLARAMSTPIHPAAADHLTALGLIEPLPASQ